MSSRVALRRAKQRKRRPRAPQRDNIYQGSDRSAVKSESCRIRSIMAPDVVRVRLKYVDGTISMLNAGGAQFAVKTFNANDSWDPDPAIGSGNVTGFREWANLFTHWRVRKCSYKITITDTTSIPIKVFAAYSSTSPSIASVFDVINLSETPFCSPTKVIAPIPSGQCIANLYGVMDLGRLYGNQREYIARETFCGKGAPSPASPTSLMMLTLCAYSSTSWSVNLDVHIELMYDVEFFGRYQAFS